jgi:hypothetical protein
MYNVLQTASSGENIKYILDTKFSEGTVCLKVEVKVVFKDQYSKLA